MPTIHTRKAPIQIDHCLEATNREPLSLQHVLHISPGVIFGTFIIGPGDLKKDEAYLLVWQMELDIMPWFRSYAGFWVSFRFLSPWFIQIGQWTPAVSVFTFLPRPH